MTSTRPALPLHLLLIVFGILVFGIQSPAVAQKAPAAGYSMPAGGKVGTTVDVRLGGYDWTPDVQFLLHDQRVKLEVLSKPGEVITHLPPYWFGIKSYANDPLLPREVTARFVIPSDLPPGPVRWCVANASGGGTSGIFMVGQYEEISEDEHQKQPQRLDRLPITINGRLLRIEEVDRYQFKAERSGVVTCDLAARRLGSDFYGAIEIFDESGRRLEQVLDTEGVDPTLTFLAQAGQIYTIAVHDLDFRGFRNYSYRLTVNHGPRVIAAIPAAGRHGETRTVEFIGIGVATGQNQLENITRDITFPADAAQSQLSYRLQTPHGEASEFPLTISNLTELVELPSNNENDRKLTLPCAVTGRLTEQDRKDHYLIAGKNGDFIRIRAESRCVASSVDLALSLIGPDGKEVAGNDDAPGTTDARISTTLPADGDYRIVISDVAGPTDSQRSIYRLVVEPVAGDFRLQVNGNGIVNLPIHAASAILEGTVVREGGFKEPIKLSVTGLPTGVSVASEVVIEPTAQGFKIPLKIEPNAPASASFVQIQGSAQLSGVEFVRPVMAPSSGSLVSRDPAASMIPTILMTTTLKPPFKIKPTEADGGRRVNRGATHLAELVVERDKGFTGEIILDMAGPQQRHRQGIHGPVFTIGPELRSVNYPVFVPEHLETARTSRIGLIGMAKIADPSGAERYILANVEGQITMSIEGALLKLSQTADELTVPVGQSFAGPVKLARLPSLTGDVTIELLVPTDLKGLIEATPLIFSPDKNSGELTIRSVADQRLVGNRVLTARATGARDGYPVVSEAEIEVEFIAAPTTAATAP